MSIHIGAEPGQVASTVLLPGDPLRARFIADTLLEDAFCFNQVRGMLGYTGRYGGKTVSAMGSGMGIPTLSIYVNELIAEYNVRTLIRVGTCGALQPDLEIGDIVLVMSSSTDSQVNRLRFGGLDYAPAASFDLLLKAYQAAQAHGIQVHVGGNFSSDTFYGDDPDWWRVWADHGVLTVEMESAGLYTLAAKYRVRALSILTVSDSLVTGAQATAEQRERGFPRMAELALEIAD
ncbi:MAG: purine-nucleoside phosphorylase [Anaerolineae bacterium]|nr:purine-nucleoside phosphorylase [Anaerolineae bacterium]